MFPGEGGIDLVALTRAMPDDITISIEVPTVQLAKTLDAEARRITSTSSKEHHKAAPPEDQRRTTPSTPAGGL